MTVGANRVVRGVAIPNPVGDPGEEPAVEFEIRKKHLEKALRALCEPIKEQTLFE